MLNEDFQTWRCSNVELALNKPRIMGILNVTPDSFSDGGRYKDAAEALDYAYRMLDSGADIIDVGGESTRPGATPVTIEEEVDRVVPIVKELAKAGATVSIDTRHAAVAKMCVRLGASIINDVSGFTDEEMVDVAAKTKCGCIVMHSGEVSDYPARKSVMLDSDPRSKADLKEKLTKEKTLFDDIDEEEETSQALPPHVVLRRFTTPDSTQIMRKVMGFLGNQTRTLMQAGVDHSRIAIDAGAGFGKDADEDVVIQRATSQLVSMGFPVVCAVSRKRFVGALSGVDKPQARDAATVGIALSAANAGARILRVHNVSAMSSALNTFWSISHPSARVAYVSIGSNVGDRVGYLARAIDAIDAIPLTCVNNVSHAYESEPAYGIATPVANAVVEIKTELVPHVLLKYLLAIEDALGRTRSKGKKTARTIDCDLIFMEGERCTSNSLMLPHPGIGERDFVLVPLEDLIINPTRFLRNAGIEVLEREDRVGIVRGDLGEISWR